MRKKREAAAAAKKKGNKVHPIDESKQALIDKPGMSFEQGFDLQASKMGLKKRSKAQNLVNKVKATNQLKPKKPLERFPVEEHQLKKSPQKSLGLVEDDPFGWDQVQAPVIENKLSKKEKNFETLNEDR